MKKASWLLTMLSLFTASVMCMNIAGCEDDESVSDADDVLEQFESLDRDNLSLSTLRISPESATITHVGQRIAFTVDDGRGGFLWDVADASAGTIQVTGNDGRTAVYTAGERKENDVVVVDALGNAAVAELKTETSDLRIVLAPSSIPPSSAGSTYTLKVAGGRSPYEWSVLDPGLGDIDTTGANGTNATYEVQSNNAGTNEVVVVDEEGSYDSATIIHE